MSQPLASSDAAPPGSDNTLAECARLAAQALTQPTGWEGLTGKTRECYQRLLTLVSYMYLANGHNSEKVWAFVSQYVDNVGEYECWAGWLANPVQHGTPVALSSADGPGSGNGRDVAAATASPEQPDGSSGPGGTDGKALVTEPPAKKQRVDNVSEPLALAGSAAVLGTEPVLPFGAPNAALQVLSKMPARATAQPFPMPAVESTTSSSSCKGEQSVV